MGPITATAVIDFVTVVFVLATMLSMGLPLTTGEILTSLGQRRLMVKSLVVNLVLVPLLRLGSSSQSQWRPVTSSGSC